VKSRRRINERSKGKARALSTFRRNIERAQRLTRNHTKPNVSLVDELIAERREAALDELDG